ncbi:hypothetical protein PWT90_08429 [Aphanocladium album]|nr:hypothetical protein PWT90_08429 [Aphanocladium album]
MSATPAAAAAPAPAPAPNGTHTNGGSQNRPAKRPNNANRSGNNRKSKQQRTKRERNITEGSSEEVLRCDIDALLKARREAAGASEGEAAPTAEENLPEPFTEMEVEIHELSSTGDGLGMVAGSDQVYVVPFTVPGDTVRIKVIRHVRGEGHSHADFLSVVTPSPLRDDARVKCQYFAKCGGCQFQMLDYAEQLRRKRRIVVKAYDNFSNLPKELVPEIQDTIGSPLQYGYRTKLTPHFDGPPGGKRGRNPTTPFASCPDIGFMQKGRRKVLDIEDCPIGTEAVRLGNKSERKRMQEEYGTYKRGATLLLRENTARHPKDSDAAKAELAPYATKSEYGDFVDVKSCETDSKATTTEYIGDYIFTNPAGSFFQNNNSILPVFTSYIRDRILPKTDGTPINTPSA